MSSTNYVYHHSHLGAPIPSAPQASGSDDPPLIDPTQISDHFLAVFIMLVESMTIKGDTVVTGANEIKANAAAQNELNDANARIKMSVLPPNADPAKIAKVQTDNQEHAAAREDIQGMLLATRQIAQVKMTQTSTNVNLLEQDASEDSGWLQTLTTLFDVINELSPHR